MLVKIFLQIVDSLPEVIMLIDADGRILAANKKASKFFNATQQSLENRHLVEFIDNGEEGLNKTIRLWRRSRTPIPAIIKWKHISAKKASQIQCQAFLLQPANENETAMMVLRCVIGKSMTRQFTELNAELDRQKSILQKLQVSRAALEKEHEKALVTLHSIGDAVITTDAAGCVEYLNPIAEELTGWQTEQAVGLPISKVFRIVNEITRSPTVDPVQCCLEEGRAVGLANHTALISRDGIEYVIEDSAAPIRNKHGTILGVVLVFRDVTGDRLAQRQLEYLAQHDSLTSLKNRYYFEQQLDHQVKVATRTHHFSALLYIDLDQFKIINDSAGHAAGDEVLMDVARRFHDRLRQSDILARLGGDEFGVILNDVDPLAIHGIADSYIQAMNGCQFQWEGKFHDITCSIGAILIDKTIKTPAEALRQADIACYVAKHDGRNRSHVYRSEDEQIISTLGEMSVIQEVKLALGQDRFTLFFQPIKMIGGEKIVMHEVLLRLWSADDSLVSPGNFIPIVERHGLMTEVDAWVIRHATQQLLSNYEHNKNCQFTVNLSGSSLGDSKILKMLKTFAMQAPQVARCLILEITETSAVTHIDKANMFISELHELGIRFALDDFGTGFSSFNYLKHLPVEYIKIDGTFVRDIASDPVDQAMVRSINHIAHSLDKLTIAECVEDEAILTLLQEIGVDMAQGFYIGKPGPQITT